MGKVEAEWVRFAEELRAVAREMRATEDAVLVAVASWLDEEAREAEFGDTFEVRDGARAVVEAWKRDRA